MQTLKTFFLSRKTVITILLLILATTLAGGLIPQKIATSAPELSKWITAHPFLTPWADRLGLFHVFSTPWFALLLFMASTSLLLSTMEQFRSAYRNTVARLGTVSQHMTTIDVTEDILRTTLRRFGYRQLGGSDFLRLVRQPWGYWSNALLHTGILVIIAVSLFVALTQQRGVLTLVEGEVHSPQQPWIDEDLGRLAPPFLLTESVRLDRLRITMKDDKSGQQAASDISFISQKSGEDKRTVAINSILHYRGLRIYQSTHYGSAFTMEITGHDNTIHYERLLISHPAGPEQAGYNDFRLPWLPYTLSTKYYADADMKTMDDRNPLLFLRLLEGERELSRVSLKRGESGSLGDLKVRLVRVEQWTDLIFVDISGMPLIFTGFMIVALGAILNYMAVPREFIATKTDEGYSVTWRAARFADFYADEFGEILQMLREGEGA